jgi:hypothetical protein
MRVLVGYFIRRTWKKPHDCDIGSESHKLYRTREVAEQALASKQQGPLAAEFDFDICEAWMHTDDDQ